jgi:orotate phosphoribosyltransferase
MSFTALADPAQVARQVARMLLEIGAVNFRPDPPFTFTSGLASPVYIDCRKLISYPRIRAACMDFACSRLGQEAGYEAFDAVAGGETAGIPFAAWIAERLGLPMLYVRKQSKGFGRDARIEGDLRDGARILLVEDLTTDGGSKVRFVEAIREAGGVGPPGRARADAAQPRHLARRAGRGARRRPFRRGDAGRGGRLPRCPARLVGRAWRQGGDLDLTT